MKQPLILVDVPSHVVLFSTDSCTFCVHAKSLLMKRGVAFEEVNLAEHPELEPSSSVSRGSRASPRSSSTARPSAA